MSRFICDKYASINQSIAFLKSVLFWLDTHQKGYLNDCSYYPKVSFEPFLETDSFICQLIQPLPDIFIKTNLIIFLQPEYYLRVRYHH